MRIKTKQDFGVTLGHVGLSRSQNSLREITDKIRTMPGGFFFLLNLFNNFYLTFFKNEDRYVTKINKKQTPLHIYIVISFKSSVEPAMNSWLPPLWRIEVLKGSFLLDLRIVDIQSWW